MTFEDLALTRITPKFRGKKNFENILSFLLSFLDKNADSVEIIRELKNLDSDSEIVLNELGKLLGLFPRPQLATTEAGAGFFQYGTNGYGFPYAGEGNLNIRELTNTEYSRLLKAAAILTTFNGTIEEWVKLYSIIAGANAYIVNKQSTYDIIIKKDLSTFEKSLIEFLTKDIDNLTVSKGFLGTSLDEQPFQYGLSAYNQAPYIKSW